MKIKKFRISNHKSIKSPVLHLFGIYETASKQKMTEAGMTVQARI